MRRASYSLLWATVLAAVVLGPAGGALAAGGTTTTTSAGDQQYLDPLASSGPSATTPAPPARAAPSRPVAPRSTTAGAARHDPSGRTLPYTGFNLWILVWVGLGLITLGLVLRRLTRQSTRPDAP